MYKDKHKGTMLMSSKPNDIDFDFLVDFCRSNLVARILMELFSRRQRNNWKPTIVSLQRIGKDMGYDFPESEIRTCCKSFTKANCGNIKRAYGERKSQFHWEYSPIKVGKEVMKRLNA